MKKSTRYITSAGIIAALYVVLTMLSTALGLSSGVIQVRFSEMLCILPIFTPAAIPGLFIGCILSNTLSGCVIWDIVFGSIATLIGAIGTRLLRKAFIPAMLPPILANTIIVPFVLIYAYNIEDAFPYLMLTVGAGELISVGILGSILFQTIKKAHITHLFGE